jgi:deoxyribodipyrimidine photolyase-related protein
MKIILVYPHQLFEESVILLKINKDKDRVFLVQDSLYFTQYNFHKLKIELHERSMSFYKGFLEEKGFKVTIVKKLSDIFDKYNVEKAFVYDVVDDYLERKVSKTLKEQNIELEILETPMFLNKNSDIEDYLGTQKNHKQKYFMRNFYVWQRKRLSLLIEKEDKPVGGKWSFDEDNRKKLPKDIKIPEYPTFEKDFLYATNFADAKKCLKRFLEEKLNEFGPYEDAVVENENILFHSVLSPYLNIGLLTPHFVVRETIAYFEANKKTLLLQSVEGFLRQIIGWREYMRLVYITLGKKIRTRNYFDAQGNIPESFWTARTGILPVDNSIEKINHSAYDHHIPRLMVLGNFMNLCGFHPDQVYKWFMERFIDSYDWVMVPNVYSMALYADGGEITTKPYISGSSYILKMSNFKKGKIDDTQSWDKIWDALFWNFVGEHFEKLQKEGRLGFIGVQYKKMSEEKKLNYQLTAKKYLKDLQNPVL